MDTIFSRGFSQYSIRLFVKYIKNTVIIFQYVLGKGQSFICEEM